MALLGSVLTLFSGCPLVASHCLVSGLVGVGFFVANSFPRGERGAGHQGPHLSNSPHAGRQAGSPGEFGWLWV